MEKMTYEEAYYRSALMSAMPVKEIGAKNPALAARLILVAVSLRGAMDAFEKEMAQVAGELKPEGYDELTARAGEGTENPLTDEERGRLEKMEADMSEAYTKARTERASDTVEIPRSRISQDDFAGLAECMDFAGTVPNTLAPPSEQAPAIPVTAYLTMVASAMVD